ncbi:hypothetical protein GALL_527220 [mine drainage metagenome]|uniref:Uncharacterized protein n=1 Tax=mine drainage metagenome TaxID=410659 RepID=A0A1J5PDW6_9ZZZZ
MIGKGIWTSQIARKAATARPIITGVLKARLPIRRIASATIASTAALTPKNRPATTGVWP